MLTEEKNKGINKRLTDLANAYHSSKTPEEIDEILKQFISEDLITYFENGYIPPWTFFIRKFLYSVIKYYKEKQEYFLALSIARSIVNAAPLPIIPPHNTYLLPWYAIMSGCYDGLATKHPENRLFYRSEAEIYLNLYKEMDAFMGCAENDIIIPKHNVQLLGEGAFGQVVSGQFRHINEDNSVSLIDIAIKNMLFDSNDPHDKIAVCRTFNQEINILLELTHPHIIQLLTYCREPDRFKISLVFKRLKDKLEDVLYKQKYSISWSDRFLWALQIAQALQYMHSKNVLHRDLKSGNIMLDENKNAVVIDFGFAIKEEEKQTKGTLAGTLFWMPPEILLGIALYSRNTDVYSFGMTVYEIVSGKSPFEQFPLPPQEEKKDLRRRFTHHVHSAGVKQPIPPRTPSAFSSILERCWAERRPTAEEVCNELNDAYQENQQIDKKIASLVI